MSNEIYIAYWSGEEPTGPGQSPTLDKTPDYIDIVPLFYVLINDDGTLDFNRLVLHNSEETIKGWMQVIRQRQQNQQKKTRFTLGILGDSFPSQDPTTFAQTIKAAVDDWGVDGVTVDYEPPDGDPKILDGKGDSHRDWSRRNNDRSHLWSLGRVFQRPEKLRSHVRLPRNHGLHALHWGTGND
jgi:Glycosyl hydrolases family 18